jgi:glutamyl/glutaminyl-tRNA synthetase
MSTTPRTRFAPSPTGYLHVGGARTALFNYAVARRLGGKFVIRVEDTDQTRNIRGADEKLFEDLRWLGLQWDEGPGVDGPRGPYYQSQRRDLYRAAATQLLDAGQAYYALETRAELEAMRQAAQQRGERGFRYPRPERFPTEAEADAARAAGKPVVVRFKMPDRDFVVQDEILGAVTITAAELSDFVIVKADGWPTYHFAVVVDDAAMQITHVLRGQEHLMNTPNHLALQEALGYPSPRYAHLPIIFNMKGAKMSKREKDKLVRDAARGDLTPERIAAFAGGIDADVTAQWLAGETQLEAEALRQLAGALGVTLPEIDIHDFRRSGYLPEVIVNFIALLGWASGDDREKYTLDELCQVFSVERIGKTNARFDRDKLLAFNTTALAEAAPERVLAALHDYLAVNPESPLHGRDDDVLNRLIELCSGMRTLADIELKAGPIFRPTDDFEIDAKTMKKWLLKGGHPGTRVLGDLRPQLESLGDWTAAALGTIIEAYAAEHELGMGKVAQPLRVAVTGTTISPQIFDTLELVGREKTLRRIDNALAKASAAKED